jgi:hypothetical protein
MAESQGRDTRNQVFFREVNERIAEAGTDMFSEDEQRELLCECGRIDCTERFSMTFAEYRRVRQSPRRFIVVPGHEDAAVERVVERRPGCWIVETFATATA